jgi:hypothetical protein
VAKVPYKGCRATEDDDDDDDENEVNDELGRRGKELAVA